VVPVKAATIHEAIRVARRYCLSYWDALIVAAALLLNCDTLYTEDMQHRQVFENRLKVVNPFLGG
jgi:predicted nucleic acid-binding protein